MTYILTRTGRKIDPINPTASDISIVDIASALSKVCRFGGQSRKFYSVAEHCVLVSRVASEISDGDDYARAALLHDAAEAYISDIITPVKCHLTDYDVIEYRFLSAIAERFEIPFDYLISPPVKMADLIVLKAEKKYLTAKDDQPWAMLKNIPSYILPINCFPYFESGQRFIDKAIALDLATHNDLEKYEANNG